MVAIVQEKDIELSIGDDVFDEILKNAEDEGYRDLNDYILHMIAFSLRDENVDRTLGERFLKIMYQRGVERREIMAFIRYSEGEEISTISKDLDIDENEVKGLIESIIQKFPYCLHKTIE